MAFINKYIKQELARISALAESRRLIDLQKKLDSTARDEAEQLYKEINARENQGE